MNMDTTWMCPGSQNDGPISYGQVRLAYDGTWPIDMALAVLRKGNALEGTSVSRRTTGKRV